MRRRHIEDKLIMNFNFRLIKKDGIIFDGVNDRFGESAFRIATECLTVSLKIYSSIENRIFLTCCDKLIVVINLLNRFRWKD